MAYNLTPEEFAAVQQQLLNYAPPVTSDANSYATLDNPYFYNGQLYAPSYGDGLQGHSMQAAPTGYTVYDYNAAANKDQSLYNGQPYTSIDNTGKVTGNGKLSGFSNQSFMDEWGPFLMVAGGMGGALAAGAGAGAAAGGEAGGAVGGAGGGAFNAAVDSQAANAAIDAAGGNALGGYTAAGTGGIGAGAGGAAGSAPLETMGGLTPMSSIPTSTFPTVTGGGTWLDSILPAGMSKYLGPAASILGAIAGSQPVKQTQTSTSAKDPRVAPYLFGDGSGSNPGLLGYTAQQLARDQSPQSVAQVQQMKNVGMGLLSAPVAGNGFAQFTKGRY